MKLTPKQEKFANLYIELGNASEAYRQSYNVGTMSTKVIQVKASEVLRNEKVNGFITVLKEELANKSMITKEMLIKKLLLIANDYDDNKEFTNQADQSEMRKAEVLSSLANSSSSIAALKQISKMLGSDAPEKIEVDQKITINITKPNDI